MRFSGTISGSGYASLFRAGARGKRGPRSDGRRFFDAILWLARSGARWRDLPEDRFGPYQTIKRRYYRWIEAGVFDRIFEAVADDPDMEWLAIPCHITFLASMSECERRAKFATFCRT